MGPFALRRYRRCFGTCRFNCDQGRVTRYCVIVNKVPCCLSVVSGSGDLTRGVSRLFFTRGTRLGSRFGSLCETLFGGSTSRVTIIATLTAGKVNVAQRRLIGTSKKGSGKTFSAMLRRLRRYKFVHLCRPFDAAGGVASSVHRGQGALFRLMSFCALFCFQFVERGGCRSSDF